MKKISCGVSFSLNSKRLVFEKPPEGARRETAKDQTEAAESPKTQVEAKPVELNMSDALKLVNVKSRALGEALKVSPAALPLLQESFSAYILYKTHDQGLAGKFSLAKDPADLMSIVSEVAAEKSLGLKNVDAATPEDVRIDNFMRDFGSYLETVPSFYLKDKMAPESRAQLQEVLSRFNFYSKAELLNQSKKFRKPGEEDYIDLEGKTPVSPSTGIKLRSFITDYTVKIDQKDRQNILKWKRFVDIEIQNVMTEVGNKDPETLKILGEKPNLTDIVLFAIGRFFSGARRSWDEAAVDKAITAGNSQLREIDAPQQNSILISLAVREVAKMYNIQGEVGRGSQNGHHYYRQILPNGQPGGALDTYWCAHTKGFVKDARDWEKVAIEGLKKKGGDGGRLNQFNAFFTVLKWTD